MSDYKTIRTRLENDVAYLQIYRPDAFNAIDETLVNECQQALDEWKDSAKIIIFEGLPEVFCFGAYFDAIKQQVEKGEASEQFPEKLYALWQFIKQGPFISIACVRGKTNAGGIGFVAACDIVLAEESAIFSLSEMLFSLFPACVLPFLLERVGRQKAHYFTLMTQPMSAQEALRVGLVDAISPDVKELLRIHMLRLGRLSKKGICRYKEYFNSLDDSLAASFDKAVAANRMMFSDAETLSDIVRYINEGTFPWENK